MLRACALSAVGVFTHVHRGHQQCLTISLLHVVGRYDVRHETRQGQRQGWHHNATHAAQTQARRRQEQRYVVSCPSPCLHLSVSPCPACALHAVCHRVLRRACALRACEEHPSARLRRLASGLPCMHVDHTTYEHTTPHHLPPNAGTPSDNDRRAAVLRQSDSMPDPLPQTFISATGVVTHFVEDKKPDHALAASIRKGRGPPDARCPCVQRFRVLRVD